MLTFDIQPIHKLAVQRCYSCGRYWAREESAPGPSGCPGCTEEARRKLNEELEVMGRRLVSQRGATTRAGKR